MKIFINKLFLSLLAPVFVFGLLLAGCSKAIEKKQAPSVLVSIPPYAYFVERIAGDTLSVQTLVPAGANPHLYEPSPKQVQQARKALLWVAVGEPSEKKIAEILQEANNSLAILNLAEHLPLLEGGHQHSHSCSHDHESLDLHFWMSPKLAKKQAELIAGELSRLFPDNEAAYKQNLHAFLNDLTLLDQEIALLLQGQKGQAILVSHAAFGYFCDDYGLVQLAVESEGKDPLPKEAERTIQQAERLSIKSVLLQAQYNNKGAELIAEKLQLPTYLVDPYSEEYLDNLRSLAQIIAKP